jgi:hypothetical protein
MQKRIPLNAGLQQRAAKIETFFTPVQSAPTETFAYHTISI